MIMEKVAVIDFGGQYAHLIANKIRRLGVYSEIVQNDVSAEKIKEFSGIILSGSPRSVYEKDAPRIEKHMLELGLPVLGICYGHQLVSQILGGTVKSGNQKEYGISFIEKTSQTPLLAGLDLKEQMWMSHGDEVSVLPDGFEIIAETKECPIAAVQNINKKIFGVQFHPEVVDSINGLKVLDNFLSICGLEKNWSAQNFFEELSNEIIQKAGDKKVFLLVSGGVDSTVTFALLNKVLGRKRVLGLHIDNGLMRQGESADIIEYMKKNGFENLIVYDASQEFLQNLSQVFEPEEKREIIGNAFFEIKSKAQEKLSLNASDWLVAQGTIYPDTIESAGTKHASKIKTHHNRVDTVLELIEKGLVIEPLASLYKDEVRDLGEKLGISRELVWRHPFPGPGLGVRCLCSNGKTDGEISQKDTDLLDKISRENDFSAIILPVRSVGVQGDSRTYAHPAAIFGKYDYDNLQKVSTLITNRMKSVNRVVFSLFSECDDKKYSLTEGYCTKLRLDKLRALDKIASDAIISSGEYEKIWQMPVVLLPVVNSKGNETIVLRPVISNEAMTARFYALSQKVVCEIVEKSRKVAGIGDIFIDISHKPPGTIEWE